MQKVTPEVWEQMQFLFNLSADKEGEELDSVLLDACPDEALRVQVKQLVQASRTRAAGPTETSDSYNDPARRSRFGAYQILRHLGTGGTGSVYLVERRTGASLQRVALKVFPGYDPESFFTRSFAREEFILATLSHPCIPKLLDASVSDNGEPFLVMEFVEGEPLDVFCDRRRLSVEGRLRLMLKVCDAVAYAHRNLVVHLDLKPSNLLADAEEPQIKLLDFGTSKLLENGRTLAIAQMVTPGYAAPEQLRGEPTTTSCDVYSLGAVMFELLSGRQAFPATSLAATAERSTGNAEPERLEDAVSEAAAERRGTTTASLRQALRGDLSTVVAKCLMPNAEARYASVDALAEDIRRFLAGRTIKARPQTLLYRTGKFLLRYRLIVIATFIAIFLILGSLGYSVLRERQMLIAARRAVQMQQFMTRLFRMAHSGATGKPAATVSDLLKVGETTLPSFISDPADLRAAQMSIAESMYDDEDSKDALPLLSKLGQEAQRAGDAAVEAKSKILASDLLYLTGKPQEAEKLAAAALALSNDRRISPELRTQIVALYVQNKDGQGDRSSQSMDQLRAAIAESERAHAPEDQTASAMNVLGLGLQARGQYAEAMQFFSRSLAIYERMPYATCDAAATVRYRGSVEEKLGEDESALASFRRSYELQQQCAGADDLGTLSAHAWYAAELVRAGQAQAAISAIEPELPKWRAVVGANSMHMRTPLSALANAYLATGRYPDAEAASREELRVLHGQVAQKSLNMATPERTLAAALDGQSRFAEAAPWAKAAVADFPVTPNMAPGVARRYANAKEVLADVQAHLGAAAK